MKKLKTPFFSYFAIVLLLTISLGCGNKKPDKDQSQHVYHKIDSLLLAKNYFAARDIYIRRQKELSEFHKLSVGVFLDHAFNEPDSSLYKSEMLFANYESQISDSLKYQIAATAHVNHSREFEYKRAEEALERLLADNSEFIPEEEKNDLENTLIIWKILKDQPRQRVVRHKTLEVPILRDKAGLQNLLITRDSIQKNFVFDTGANISTITASAAKDLGVIVLDGTFEVEAITGQKVNSQIGLAPRFAIGDIKIINAVFLIFPDEALAFPQIDYQIEGILGFPVLEALGEIQITRDDRFIVPVEQSNSEEKNLAIDFLTPLLWLEDDRGMGVYTFDTGANSTILYDNYFHLHKATFDSNAAEADYSFGGAGGHITKKGLFTTFSPVINKKSISIDSVMVLKEPIKPGNHFLGNLGQDFIGKFEKMTINFDRMFIRFD